ncbi:MAG: YcxB family protein [Anaerolineae bacterium]
MEEYVLTVHHEWDDVKAYVDFYLQTAAGKRYIRTLQRGQMLFFFIVVALFSALVGFGEKSLGGGVFIGILILLIVAGIEWFRGWRAGVPWYIVDAQRTLYRQIQKGWTEHDRQRFFAPSEYRFTPQGISITSELSHSEVRWQAVEQIGCLPQHVCLQIGSMHVIPRRAFESDEAFQQFCQAVQEFYQQALEEQPPSPARLPQVIHSTSPARPSKLRVLLVGLIILVVVCCVLPLALDPLFSQQIARLPGKEDIPATLEGYMQAMQGRNIARARTYFSTSSSELSKLEEELNGVNFARYANYRSLEITDFSLSFDPTYGSGEVTAAITYQSHEQGSLSATLETQKGSWKIVSISVSVPPTEVLNFLQQQGMCK